MPIKIVADSSANLSSLSNADFSSVPLKIQTREKEYSDTPELDVAQMMRELSSVKGKTGTACPGPGDWLRAFGNAREIIALNLTSKLSGSYNSCKIAADLHMQEYPGSKVFTLDSLSTGPELELLAEKAQELISSDLSFDAVCDCLRTYSAKTHLAFTLESLQNFVRNGRVNPALGKLVEMLHIVIVGKASDVGDLEPINKCKGRSRALKQLWENMKALGYSGGKIRIRHTENLQAAQDLRTMILSQFPDCDVRIGENRGLCSYYAEKGCLLVGFET